MSIPRNAFCACGSGKKFKKCCWNPKAVRTQSQPHTSRQQIQAAATLASYAMLFSRYH